MNEGKDGGDYKASLVVSKTAKEVYAAINDVAAWWIGDVQGQSRKVGDEFTYVYKEYHDTTQKVIELIPNKRIVWQVSKSRINFVKNKNEWLDTKIIFDLTPTNDGIQIDFTHSGLTPAIECYDGCSGGWDFYIKESLQSFLENGKGIDPNF